ncbi:hypothetical protein TNCV_3003161 [Trichonephila clavipes]|nr:hypothetical protein TNCV_3003161 [Trichonephila clavipes]
MFQLFFNIASPRIGTLAYRGIKFVSLCRRTLPPVNRTSVLQTSSALRRCQNAHRRTGISRESKQKLSVIQWCMENGLSAANAESLACTKAMRLIKWIPVMDIFRTFLIEELVGKNSKEPQEDINGNRDESPSQSLQEEKRDLFEGLNST